MFTVIVAALIPAAEPTRIPPKLVSLNQPNGTLVEALTAFNRQTGIPIAPPADAGMTPCPLTFNDVPVWDALQRVADKTGTRVEPRDRGRSVALVKRTGPNTITSTDGPFRCVVRQVRSVLDFDTGKAITELTLDIHWEPRVTVFRSDAEPTISAAADDRGSKITAGTSRGKTPPDGATYSTTVRLDGVPRGATKITQINGTFTVTVADRMLGFRFPLADKLPASQDRDGVRATLTRAGRVDNRFEVEVSLVYPPGQPEFESFESFVTGNRATLVAGNKSWPSSDPEIVGDGRRVTAVYRFPPDTPAAATFEYTTPAPLVEYPVRFEFRDIPLP